MRHARNPVPIGGGIENPLVMRARCGLYLLIFADNHLGPSVGFGFGWSKDGVNWENNTGAGPDSGLKNYVLSPAPHPHQSVRTPLALVEHEDRPGYFTLFFTAFEMGLAPISQGWPVSG